MSEPQKTPHFDSLIPLRDRLKKIHQRGPHAETFESSLVQMVDSLEQAHYRARFQFFIGQNFDNHADMRNLRKAMTQLEALGETLEEICKIRNSFYRW